MNYGRAIKVARTAAGLKLEELGVKVGVGASHLSLIEAGQRNPSLPLLRRISKALRIPHHLLTLLASDHADVKQEDAAGDLSSAAMALLRLMSGRSR